MASLHLASDGDRDEPIVIRVETLSRNRAVSADALSRTDERVGAKVRAETIPDFSRWKVAKLDQAVCDASAHWVCGSGQDLVARLVLSERLSRHGNRRHEKCSPLLRIVAEA